MRIHPGFASIEQLVETMAAKGLRKSKCAIVTFRGQHYAIAFQGWDEQIVAGSQEMWYRENGWSMHQPMENRPLPYPITSRQTRRLTDTIARELLEDDRATTVTLFGSDTTDRPRQLSPSADQRYMCYLVWLGITFKTRFFGPHEMRAMNRYFKDKRTLKSFFHHANALSINPFHQVIQLSTGRYHRYRIAFSFDKIEIGISPAPLEDHSVLRGA